ncbi:Zinc finger, C2H2 type [Aphelenchoides bicaudatus]|nr:Zinc finger, C2H2 type [Aphelenchoides bicaudatus]
MSSRVHYQQFGTGAQAQNRQRWRCGTCNKVLSSKRSYDEHMNVHNDKRPFACDQCKYAAASQMTLRRHKLRNHIPRAHWGYQCPHCSDSYMEPASYQQHVGSRHAGFSATFGCNYCHFTTKSSKHFREHLVKHLHVVARHSDTEDVDSCNINVSEFLVDDENGQGHCSAGEKHLPTKSGVSLASCSNTSFLECGPDFFKSPLESKNAPRTNSANNRLTSNRMTNIPKSRVSIPMKQERRYIVAGRRQAAEFEEYLVRYKNDESEVPEIQNEVIIETEAYKPATQLKAEIDDFGLD